ncbi:MAG: hypothetical protein U0169_21655 [Polyangiaceae bacterium]
MTAPRRDTTSTFASAIPIDERSTERGLATTFFARPADTPHDVDGFLVERDGPDGDETAVPVPAGTLAHVFARFGRPFDPDAAPGMAATRRDGRAHDPSSLAWDVDGVRLRLVPIRHLDAFDVVARDWVVFDDGRHPPLALLAVTLTRALRHVTAALGRAAAGPPAT